MPITITRKFDGISYWRDKMFSRKVDAKKYANESRKNKYKARVVKESTWYSVYLRH